MTLSVLRAALRSIGAVMLASLALTPLTASSAAADNPDLVEFEKMTWVEVQAALAAGRTTALIYTGGVEERGPQNVNGGHNLMAHAIVEAIARRLGNAIFMPVLPFTPNEAHARFPGTIGLTNDLLAALLTRITEQSIVNGFRNVILMGDHGGGQPRVYESVAKALNGKYAARGVHVYYCDEVYRAANDSFDRYLAAHGYPLSLHGGIPDTSVMLYLDKDHTWVRRNLIESAVGSPIVNGKPQLGPDGPLNGIIGDARRSDPQLGKRLFEMKVDYAVRQIRGFLASP
jgi:creatinine amidohydrolase